MNEVVYENKFVSFIDIIGFKKLIERSETGDGKALPSIISMLEKFGETDKQEFYQIYGPEVCPGAARINKHLDFKITQISDCLVVSSEVSPAGLVNLLNYCHRAISRMMAEGLMCRGYVTSGPLYHTNHQVIGTAYQKAFEMEHEVKAFSTGPNDLRTPFVVLDAVVDEFIKNCSDKCVQEIISRITKHDGEVTALYPFKRLAAHQSLPAPGMKLRIEDDKRSNQYTRERILGYKAKLAENTPADDPGAVMKAQHYQNAYDEQLKICDEFDQHMDSLPGPYLPTMVFF